MKRKITIVVITLSFIMCLCACGNNMKKYSGIYMGETGHTCLVLNEDGTANYTEDDVEGTGAWVIKDDRIVVSVTSMSFDIYADLIDDEELLFYADEGEHWYDEVFTKYN